MTPGMSRGGRKDKTKKSKQELFGVGLDAIVCARHVRELMA